MDNGSVIYSTVIPCPMFPRPSRNRFACRGSRGDFLPLSIVSPLHSSTCKPLVGAQKPKSFVLSKIRTPLQNTRVWGYLPQPPSPSAHAKLLHTMPGAIIPLCTPRVWRFAVANSLRRHSPLANRDSSWG